MSRIRSFVPLLVGVGLAGCAVGPNYHTSRRAPARWLRRCPRANLHGGEGVLAGAPGRGCGLRHVVELPQRSGARLPGESSRRSQPGCPGRARSPPGSANLRKRSHWRRVARSSSQRGGRTGHRHRPHRGRAAQPPGSADNTSGLKHINELGGFDSVWELDVFGKYRREIEAARADAQATLAQRNAVSGFSHRGRRASLCGHAWFAGPRRDLAHRRRYVAGVFAHRRIRSSAALPTSWTSRSPAANSQSYRRRSRQ